MFARTLQDFSEKPRVLYHAQCSYVSNKLGVLVSRGGCKIPQDEIGGGWNKRGSISFIIWVTQQRALTLCRSLLENLMNEGP